jgi:hypothetical protein
MLMTLPSYLHLCKECVLQQEVNALGNWFCDNGLVVNCSKSNVILFGTYKRLAKVNKPTLKLANTALSQAKDSIQYLGLFMDSNLNWHDHMDCIAAKVSSRLSLLGRLRKYITVDVCKQLHGSLIQPLYEYCDVVWSNTDKSSLERLLRLQKRGARLILKRKIRECSLDNLFKELVWVSLTDRQPGFIFISFTAFNIL